MQTPFSLEVFLWVRQHRAVVSTVTSQQEDPGLKSALGFSVWGTPASSHNTKACMKLG